ncbi:MAG: molecular chaperone [Pelomonas sp.]|nr:molecular chaperone [Roseateles sp.]
MFTTRTYRWLAGLALALLAQAAMADLMLFPTRIVFDRQRAAQVELMNQGQTPETYRIRLVNRRMGPNGEFVAVETPGPGERFADAMLQFSPHQVTIPPGGTQIVRIALRRPVGLAEGEYRSHLQFDRVADASGASSIEDVAHSDGSSVGVVIQALIGASIPVIVRQGDTQAKVALSDLQVLPAGPGNPQGAIALQLDREGNRSVYGDLVATVTTPGGVTLEVGRAGGVAVYVPNASRRAVLPLQLPDGALGLPPGGVVKVAYRDRPDAGGRLLAEASLALP